MPPPFPPDLDWVGVAPLSMEMFKGQVVLIEVWESSCINCLRSLPVLALLQNHYRNNGFMVIGIHSPEYSFNASRAVVERATRRFGLEFPVASDTRMTFWRSWDVRGWPTVFLLDAHGRLAHLHQGEMNAAALERRIRALLREARPQSRFPETAIPLDRDSYAPECGFATPEIPTQPGMDFLLNPEGYKRGQTVVYGDPGPVRSEGTFFLRGPWSWLYNGLQRGAGRQQASIGITYTAKEVYAVIGNAAETGLDVEVRQDGRPLTEANRGSDVEITRDGRSLLRVAEPRLHYLVVNADGRRHELELFPLAPAFLIHSFSFGNRCQTEFPHR